MPDGQPRIARTLTALALALWGQGAWAGDRFTDELQAAYVPYRAALFRTNSGDAAAARQALADARTAWRERVMSLAGDLRDPYARDADVATTLREVEQVYASAAAQVEAGQLPQAHETLEQVRDLVADLRHRNQVVVYSDHMNAYHSAMEQILQEGPALLDHADGRVRLAMQAGVLAHTARRLAEEATPALAGDADFKGLLAAVQGSVKALTDAVVAGDAAAMRAALGRLKAPYSKLFIRYG